MKWYELSSSMLPYACINYISASMYCTDERSSLSDSSSVTDSSTNVLNSSQSEGNRQSNSSSTSVNDSCHTVSDKSHTVSDNDLDRITSDSDSGSDSDRDIITSGSDALRNRWKRTYISLFIIFFLSLILISLVGVDPMYLLGRTLSFYLLKVGFPGWLACIFGLVIRVFSEGMPPLDKEMQPSDTSSPKLPLPIDSPVPSISSGGSSLFDEWFGTGPSSSGAASDAVLKIPSPAISQGNSPLEQEGESPAAQIAAGPQNDPIFNQDGLAFLTIGNRLNKNLLDEPPYSSEYILKYISLKRDALNIMNTLYPDPLWDLEKEGFISYTMLNYKTYEELSLQRLERNIRELQNQGDKAVLYKQLLKARTSFIIHGHFRYVYS